MAMMVKKGKMPQLIYYPASFMALLFVLSISVINE